MPMPSASSVKGTGYNQITMPNKTGWQQQMAEMMASGAMPGLEGGIKNLSSMAAGGTPEMWQELEAPAMRQFNELQGGLSSRFSGMGGTGGRKSSGFQNTMSAAGTDLAERLQSQRMGLQQNAMSQLMGLSQSLLGQDMFNTQLTPKKKPWYEEFMASLGPSIGQGAGLIGGMWGANKLGLTG